jgi:hypothetical protein
VRQEATTNDGSVYYRMSASATTWTAWNLVQNYGVSNTRTETRNDAGLQGNVGATSGYYETSAPAPLANWPVGTNNWQHLLDIRHSNPVNNYAMQVAGSFFDQEFFGRKTNGSASTPWRKFVMETAPWTNVTFITPWVNYGSGYQTAQYRKIGDRVELRGLVRGGANLSTIFSLPVGFRPPARLLLSTQTNTNVAGRVDVDTLGNVIMQNGDTGWISLDNLNFSTI